jgi:hypothetical protein
MFVDYSSVHYINVKKPWIGSASATAKLNKDGTLAESAAEVEDKTVETILSALPLKEVLLGAIGGGGDSAALILGGAKQTPVQLAVTQLRFKHVLSRTEKAGPPCAAKSPIAMTDQSANRRRDAVADEGGKAKEDENAIGVSGKIVLPKKEGGL